MNLSSLSPASRAQLATRITFHLNRTHQELYGHWEETEEDSAEDRTAEYDAAIARLQRMQRRVSAAFLPASKLLSSCPAVTSVGERETTLPVGAETDWTLAALEKWLHANPEAARVPALVRCPGAANPAPYMVPADSLRWALP